MSRVRLAFLAALLLFSLPAEASQHRSQAARHAFMKANPCPSGPDQGSVKRCRGYVIDHIVAIACHGADQPKNMQWQTVEEGKAKDLWERDGCKR